MPADKCWHEDVLKLLMHTGHLGQQMARAEMEEAHPEMKKEIKAPRKTAPKKAKQACMVTHMAPVTEHTYLLPCCVGGPAEVQSLIRAACTHRMLTRHDDALACRRPTMIIVMTRRMLRHCSPMQRSVLGQSACCTPNMLCLLHFCDTIVMPELLVGRCISTSGRMCRQMEGSRRARRVTMTRSAWCVTVLTAHRRPVVLGPVP